jgi:outer membrane protein OmpA-like peptidoglycan-associated protein
VHLCLPGKGKKQEKKMFGTWKVSKTLPLAVIASSLAVGMAAQVPNPTTVAPGARSADVIAEGNDGIYVYHVKVVDRELDAVNYLNRSGSTKIGFQGTNLLPQASGEAKVNAVTGKTNISVELRGLKQANSFGPEYLTYVLWAISSNGRPQNLGELELAGDKASLNVSTSYQTFGMIVTAEPYFAVSQPSDVVVLQNVFTDKTSGILQTVSIHYTLLPKGLYAPTNGQDSIAYPVTDRMHTPLALFEAWNAQRIAKSVGADKYAPEIMQKAGTELQNAVDIQNSKGRDVKMEFTYARGATQNFEDARIVTLRKQADERAAAQVAAKNAAEANAAASAAAAQAAQQQAAAAQDQAAQAAQAKQQADAARAQAEAAEARAKSAENAANARATASEQGAQALREKLRAQLNAVLQTTETARGLIVNLNDVLFDTGKYTLKSNAQISLAKIATIIALYPSLHIKVEGYTDSTGAPAFNQTLSENRADTVMNFLATNGVPPANVTAKGYGATNFVGDNSTAAGRAQNRRVDLVVYGQAIGVAESNPDAANQ